MFISSFFVLFSIYFFLKFIQFRLECLDLHSNFSYLMSHQSKIYCGLKVDWIDRLVRECRVEGLHLYLRESGTLQLMTAWSLGLKISNLCLVFFFSYSVPSTIYYGTFSIQRYLKHTDVSFLLLVLSIYSQLFSIAALGVYERILEVIGFSGFFP